MKLVLNSMCYWGMVWWDGWEKLVSDFLLVIVLDCECDGLGIVGLCCDWKFFLMVVFIFKYFLVY